MYINYSKKFFTYQVKLSLVILAAIFIVDFLLDAINGH